MNPFGVIAEGLLLAARSCNDQREQQLEHYRQQLAGAGNGIAECSKMIYGFVCILESEPEIYRQVDSVFRRESHTLAEVKNDAERFLQFWSRQ